MAAASSAARTKQSAVAPVQVAATYELAAEEIRRAVTVGRYQPGDRLPNERELSAQLGVSRTSLREATRALAAEGLLEVRRGAHGGIRVAAREATSPAALRRILRRIVHEVEDVLDLRVTLEAGAARLAAERHTAEDLAAVRDAFHRMQSIFDEDRLDAVSEFWRADVEFHTALAAASRSTRLHRAVEDARVEFIRPLGHVFSTIQANAHDGHLEILQALEARDPAAAEEAARQHIEITRHVVRSMAGTSGGDRLPHA